MGPDRASRRGRRRPPRARLAGRGPRADVPRTSRRIVDEVLDKAARRGASRLKISFAPGEADLLARLRQQCAAVSSRPAGATCLVDLDLGTEAAVGPTTLVGPAPPAESDTDG